MLQQKRLISVKNAKLFEKWQRITANKKQKTIFSSRQQNSNSNSNCRIERQM